MSSCMYFLQYCFHLIILQAYIACALGIDMIGYGSVMYGVVSCLSAILSGFIIRKTGRIPMFTTGILFILTGAGVILSYANIIL